jgi:hypothetical protein
MVCVRLALGTLVGLSITEAIFRVRDGGAFPRLNIYEPDPDLAVRLRKLATETIAFNGNPPSHVRINHLGFRGADPTPIPTEEEILVVGDSQAFGLGVEENDAFATQIGYGLNQPVFNAGVPTYGPPEFLEVTRRWLEKRRPKMVIYVVNLANDLFEAARPNLDRHAVLDGWALHKESVPPHVLLFPGRELLLRDSHAFFAYRAWRHHEPGDPSATAEAAEPPTFASDGSWRDLLGEATVVDTKRHDADVARGRVAELEAEIARAEKAHAEDVERAKLAAERTREQIAETYELLDGPEGQEWTRSNGQPRDIRVPFNYGAEAGPRVGDIAERLVTGAEVRRDVEIALRRKAAQELKMAEAKKALASRADVEGIERQIEEQKAALRATLEALSPMRRPLAAEAKLCEEHGAKLYVLVLPLDVQVSDGEWAKYGRPVTDMSASLALMDDIRRVGDDLGVPVWSAYDVLKQAEPGAFLNGDIHMTPKGHAAVANGFLKFLHQERVGAAR